MSDTRFYYYNNFHIVEREIQSTQGVVKHEVGNKNINEFYH